MVICPYHSSGRVWISLFFWCDATELQQNFRLHKNKKKGFDTLSFRRSDCSRTSNCSSSVWFWGLFVFSFLGKNAMSKVPINTPEDHDKLQSRATLWISLKISRRHTPASIIHVIVFGPVLTSYQIATTEALCRHLHGEKNRRKHPCPLLAAVPKQQQSIVLKTVCLCVNPAAGHLLVLHHVHYDPVWGVDVFPDEIFEHDERFH